MKSLINYICNLREERKWLKYKPCVACVNFDWFMGSAGVCTAKKGCPATRMKDCSDYCDCGAFKKK